MSDVSVNWFEIPTNNLAKAKAFYTQVLAREMGELPGPDGGAMTVFMADDGPAGALLPAEPGSEPGSSGPRLYLNCPDMDSAIGRVAAAGGKVLSEKTAIGPHGFIATFSDPDGNVVALHHDS